MNRTGSPVENFAFADQALCFRLRNLARVSQLRRDVLVAIELGEQRLVTDGHEDLFLPFLGFLRRSKQAHAFAGPRQLAIVAIEILRIGELVWRSDDIAEHFVRRRNRVRHRQVIHQLSQEKLFGCVLFDLLRVIVVLGRSGVLRRFCFDMRARWLVSGLLLRRSQTNCDRKN